MLFPHISRGVSWWWGTWALIQIPLLMLPERKTIPERGFQQMSLDITEGSMSVPSGKPQTDAAQERSQVLVLLLAWFLGFTRFHMCLYIVCVYINRHTRKSIYIYMRTCKYVCVYIYIHIHTHACTCTHICTCIPLPATWKQNKTSILSAWRKALSGWHRHVL